MDLKATLFRRYGRRMVWPLAVIAACLVFGYVFYSSHVERNVMAAEGNEAMLVAHNVFFSLKDSNEKNRQLLVDACHKYLSAHEGTVYYAAGVVASDYDRPVNDRDWDVGLHLVFKTKADHDRYQTHPEHLKFIEENRETWAKVRVFDSYVQGRP